MKTKVKSAAKRLTAIFLALIMLVPSIATTVYAHEIFIPEWANMEPLPPLDIVVPIDFVKFHLYYRQEERSPMAWINHRRAFFVQ